MEFLYVKFVGCNLKSSLFCHICYCCLTNIVSYMIYIHAFVVCLRTKCCMFGSNGSFVIIMKPKAKENLSRGLHVVILCCTRKFP